jgi:hypothetical protein
MAGERRLLGRLHHDRAAGRQRRAPLPRHHHDREVPGDDLARHADRLAPRGAEVVATDGDGLAVDLVGPPGVVAQCLEGQRDVAGAGVVHGLAVVERLERGEFVDLRLDQVGQPQHDPAPLASVHARPGAFVEGLSRRQHRGVHVGRIRFRDLCDHLLGGRVDRGEGPAAAGRRPLPVDEQLRLADLRRGRAARCYGGSHESGPEGRRPLTGTRCGETAHDRRGNLLPASYLR